MRSPRSAGDDGQAMTIAGARPLDASDRARVALPFIGCTLIWSSTWIVIRTQLDSGPPLWSVAYRFAIACAAMTIYARITKAPLRFTARQHSLALLYGIAQYALNYQAVYLAERAITSGLVAVLFALLVVPNAIFGWLVLKQGVSRPFLLGSAVAMVGLLLLFSHELAASPTGRAAIWAGIGWSLAGVLFSSIANILQATERAKTVAMPSLIAWGMAYGTAFDILTAFVLEGRPRFDPSPAYWAGTLYLGLVGSALAFTFYFQVIRAIGPARAAYSSVLVPVLAMALSTLLEGYRWTPRAEVGGLLSLAGLFVALKARQAPRPARKSE